MRLIDLQTRWLRILVELLPPLDRLQHYRLAREDLAFQARRRMQRAIRRRLRQSPESP